MSGAKKILVIEDDFDIREIIKMILSDEGYEVSELDCGHGVDEELVRSTPDVILLDVMLGDTDGRDICAHLKAEAGTAQIPIIIVSATHGHFSAVGTSCRANDYLAKPFDITELLRMVKFHTAA